jgi:TfoX/Sxy family transcriptional regulator of competence genes
MRCSCGCGRKVRLRDLRANARARTARKLVAEMEALSFETDDDEYRRAFLFEGVSWRNQYTRIVHRELAPQQIREEALWRNWSSGARLAVIEARRGAVPAAASPPGEDALDSVASTKAVIKPERSAGDTAEAVIKPERSAGDTAEAVIKPERSAVDTAGSEELARRIREVMDGRDGVTEGEMFGGGAWMVNGNMACGTAGDSLVVRVAPSDRDRVLAEAHVHPLMRGKRTMRGFVTVDSAAIADDADLTRWIDAAAGYAAWLPPR